MTTKSQLTKVN